MIIYPLPQVPADCDVLFCNERIALWTYFRQELERRFEQTKFNSNASGDDVHDGSWAEKLMNKIKGSRGPSVASQGKNSSANDVSDHISEIVAKMGGAAMSHAERESRASRNSELVDGGTVTGMMTSPVSRTSLASMNRRESHTSEHRSRVESTMDPILEGKLSRRHPLHLPLAIYRSHSYLTQLLYLVYTSTHYWEGPAELAARSKQTTSYAKP